MSEGQFYQVLLFELDAIRKVCNTVSVSISLFLPLTTQIYAGVCIVGAKLPTTGDIYHSSEATPYETVCEQS